MVEGGELYIKHKYLDKEIKGKVNISMSKERAYHPYTLEITFGTRKDYVCSSADVFELFKPLNLNGELRSERLCKTAGGDTLYKNFEKFSELEELVEQLKDYKGETSLLKVICLKENKDWKSKLFMEAV